LRRPLGRGGLSRGGPEPRRRPAPRRPRRRTRPEPRPGGGPGSSRGAERGRGGPVFVYVIRRMAVMIPTLFLVSVVCFFVIQIAPGSFTDRYLEDPRMSPAQVARIQQQLGLDRPPHEQYLRWVGGIVTRGDFGFSFFANRPVWSVIGERLWWTILVAGITMGFAWLVAVPLGIVTALRRNGVTDFLASFLGYVGLATPDFLVALLLVSLVLQSGG